LRQRHKPACRDPAEAVLHAVDFFFPNRFPEPNLETVDLEPTPLACEKVAEFVDENDDVEDHQNDENQQNHLEDGGNNGHGWSRIGGNLAEVDIPASSLNFPKNSLPPSRAPGSGRF
jgi:hypothetical protein